MQLRLGDSLAVGFPKVGAALQLRPYERPPLTQGVCSHRWSQYPVQGPTLGSGGVSVRVVRCELQNLTVYRCVSDGVCFPCSRKSLGPKALRE